MAGEDNATPPGWLDRLTAAGGEWSWWPPLVRATAVGRGGDETRAPAAVLALLAGPPGRGPEPPPEAGLLLTHRSPRMRSHAGQVALPGGKREESDESLTACALREAREETGLNPAAVTTLGEAPARAVRPSGRPVTTVLGYAPRPERVWVNSPHEADEVFYAPLGALADPRRRLLVDVRGTVTPAFRSRGFLVWGFTGMIVDALLRTAGWERPWDTGRVLGLDEALASSRNGEPAAT